MMKDRKPEPIKTLLISPPVWTPVTPYLALPLLVSYLRREGFKAVQWDASLDFFTRHLLLPESLLPLVERIREHERSGAYRSAPPSVREFPSRLRKDALGWERRISQVGRTVETLRSETSFYEPQGAIRAQRELYRLLRFASVAFHPMGLTFNTCSHPDIVDLHHLLRFCEDGEKNPFLPFFREFVPRKIGEDKPELIGISLSTSHQILGGFTLARYIKRAYPSIHVTLGGNQAFRLQETFAREPSLLPEFCDSLVPARGERPLGRLIRTLTSGEPLSGVPDLVYHGGGRIVFNEIGDHEPITDLPPPDFSDLPLREYLSPTPIIPIRLSEGCYWGKCTFCSRYDTRQFRTVPPDQGADLMEALQRKYQVSCFTVNDDCLTPPYLEALSKAVLERRLKVQISLWCKPVASFTRERLQLLSEAGVRLIRWGLETGHPRILSLMNKGTSLKETLRVMKDASEAGIWNHGTIIFGFPSETEEEAKETVRFLERNGHVIHSSIFFRFVLLNNSYILRHPEEFDIQSVSGESNLFSYDHRYTCKSGMDEEGLSSFLQWAQDYRLHHLYGHPFWYHLRVREYLLLYAGRYGAEAVWKWKVKPEDPAVYKAGDRLEFRFLRPEEVPPEVLEKIYYVVGSSGEVGTSWVQENLKKAFLIGYVTEEGRVVGTMSLKHPKEQYVRKIEQKTGLDLQGYLERGYGSVRPEYRSLGIGDRLIKGLVNGAPGRKLYVLIRLDNPAPVKLAIKNNTRLAASYRNEKTGHEIGVFVNE